MKVAILGFGKTGKALLSFCLRREFDCYVWDTESINSEDRMGPGKQAVQFESGDYSLDVIKECDEVLLSPGISPKSLIYHDLLDHSIRPISEIEFASRYCNAKNVVAVTGTSGKTTVVTLISMLLKSWAQGSEQIWLCGNIGVPWISLVDQIKEEDWVVLELSSFQLKHCYQFSPKFAMILNISENHLDWHEDIQDYADSKGKIFKNQGFEDVAFFLEEEADNLRGYLSDEARQVLVSTRNKLENSNTAFLKTFAEVVGISESIVTNVLNEFQGLPHRLEQVAEVSGITYINDSKSTTVSSLQWALSRMPSKKVWLIAGGKAKNDDFSPVKELIQEKTKGVILIGRDAKVLAQNWESVANLNYAKNLQQAVQMAYDSSETGDVVLLSPACASFDMFKSYEDRGNQFKHFVQILPEKSCAET